MESRRVRRSPTRLYDDLDLEEVQRALCAGADPAQELPHVQRSPHRRMPQAQQPLPYHLGSINWKLIRTRAARSKQGLS